MPLRPKASTFKSQCVSQSFDNTSVINMVALSTETLQTSVYFLKRNNLYNEEKPYSLRFTPPENFPRSNITLEKHDVTIRNIRPKLKTLSFEKDGLTIMNLESRMSYDDFDNEEKLINIYLREVADSLCAFLGAVHVQIFEHTVCRPSGLFMIMIIDKEKVRKRHSIFPVSTGEPYKYNQPTSMAHVGRYISRYIGTSY